MAVGVSVGTLVAHLEADTAGFDAGLRRADGAAQGWARGFAKTAALGAAGAGVAIAAFSVDAIKTFAGFEKQMNEVFTLMPGITGDAMDGMTKQVKDFAREFNVLPTEVVPALYQALSRNVPKDNVFEFLETAQGLAKAGLTDLTTAVELVTSVTNAYGTENLDAAVAADQLFAAVQAGGTRLDELAGSLGGVTSSAASMGVGLDQVLASVDALTLAGMNTSEAVTGLRALLKALADQSSDLGAKFREVSGQTFPAFAAAGGSVTDALLLMREEGKLNEDQFRALFTEQEALAAGLILSGEGVENFRGALERVRGSAGAVQAGVKTMQEGTSEDIAAMEARWELFKIELGQKAKELIVSAFESITAWWEENGPLIMDMWSGLATAFTVMADIITTVGSAMAAHLAATYASLRGAISTVVGAVSWMASTTSALWQGLVEGASAFGAGVMSALHGLAAGVAAMAGTLWRPLQTAFEAVVAAIKKAWNSLASVFNSVSNLPLVGKLIPNLPKFHAGGIVPGPVGQERLILARGGERFTPHSKAPPVEAAGAASSPAITIPIMLDGREIARYVWERHGMTPQMARAS